VPVSWLRKVRQFCLGHTACAALALGIVALSRPAAATVVERIVAIVGERAILMSDLRERAHPLLVRINQELPAGAQRSAAISQLYKSVVERLVDEELISRVARRSKIIITEKEVDNALTTLARQNNITIERLLLEARAQGQTDAKYREEVRRQLLEYRVMNVRLQGRIQVRDEDLRRSYREIILQERKNLNFTVAWILLRPRPPGPSVVELANSIVRDLRQGRDFADLARQYSTDKKSAARGGELGRFAPGKLPTPIDRALLNLEPGEFTMPIHVGDGYVVARLLARDASQLPTLEEAKAELAERVYSDKMGQARRRWLDGLRKQMHVEIRL
jgi:peptidyl-prolyl cis-trans isomerase SurA